MIASRSAASLMRMPSLSDFVCMSIAAPPTSRASTRRSNPSARASCRLRLRPACRLISRNMSCCARMYSCEPIFTSPTVMTSWAPATLEPTRGKPNDEARNQ